MFSIVLLRLDVVLFVRVLGNFKPKSAGTLKSFTHYRNKFLGSLGDRPLIAP
ncbi:MULTISPECIES: hypothetical protein [Planktothricoides]|uniref:Uncharacterized protein n=1 Tax=Planktothricoides raciborskii FACHB-1370 TaxID=2949576 RepID=A0ABR8EEC7_9CYAN|nr:MULTISPECIES: hypothetical protein [Planktothricoides]MBD2545184.1 hypothetical protein [Planktothricoides raciborskii FACHB-1370]MBD2583287.1 hypothetical protein [Planktothricoides raciborskii FACHB-1261]